MKPAVQALPLALAFVGLIVTGCRSPVEGPSSPMVIGGCLGRAIGMFFSSVWPAQASGQAIVF